MKQELTFKPVSGYVILLITILALGGAIAGFAFQLIWLGVIATVFFFFLSVGYTVVNPNESCVLVLFERLTIAGINVIEARINYIAYAEEIANAMLRRQQATAIVAARFKIVEGAVSMVQMALEQLSDKKIVELDDERKAAMVSNLMVVLVSDKDASPVVNTGTLHS